MKNKRNNIICEWLEKHGDPEISKQVEQEATELFEEYMTSKTESFNSKRGLKEIQLKDPNTCEYYKEVGCVKDVCGCYTLVSKQVNYDETN